VQFQSYEGRLKSLVKDMAVETIAVDPHLVRVDDFLSSEECDYLMELSGPRLMEQADNSAASTWLEHGESPIVAAITRRIFDLMGFENDVETFYFAEKMQISKYERGQEYLPHFDAMDLTTSQRNLPHNRFATVMMYLNDVDHADGGADVWPRANKADEFKCLPCDAELRVQPKRGTLMVLYSMFADGVIDEAALHGSCPVITERKEKWTANLFFWDPFVQWSPEQLSV
jgi:prolyl 4-hydroxylase